MKYKPHKYQEYASDFIVNNPYSAILLDMGLGKTSIALKAIKELKAKGEIKRVLIIAPLRPITSWTSELNKWDEFNDLTYVVATGTEKKRLSALSKEVDIYLINTENTEWLVNYGRLDFDMLIIDESSKFKAYNSRRTKALTHIRNLFKRIVIMTGTVCSNSLMDLFSQYRILDGGERLGKYITEYRNRYFVPDKRNGTIIFSYKLLPFAEETIYEKIRDITISMKATDYLEMPELVLNEIRVDLDKKDKEVYDNLKRDMIAPLKDTEIDAVNSAVLVNKLLQLSQGAIYDEDKNVVEFHDKKLEALEDVIEANESKPILIAYNYKHDRDRIKARFNAKEILSEEDINKFNKGEIPIGLIHPKSMGMGVNLQGSCSTLVWFGLTWSLQDYLQTNSRIWRQGQKNTVVIHHIISNNTIDEDVLVALKNKETTQEALVNAVKAEIRR